MVMDTVVLEAKVVETDGRYVARIDDLNLECEGESLETAQDEMIQVMRAWIELHDGTDNLGDAMADAGFPGVNEETELQLEFVDLIRP